MASEKHSKSGSELRGKGRLSPEDPKFSPVRVWAGGLSCARVLWHGQGMRQTIIRTSTISGPVSIHTAPIHTSIPENFLPVILGCGWTISFLCTWGNQGCRGVGLGPAFCLVPGSWLQCQTEEGACSEGWDGASLGEGVSGTVMGPVGPSGRQETSFCFLGPGRFPGRSLYTTH